MNMFPNRRRGVFFNPYEDMMNELLDPYNDFNLSTSELFRISRPMVVPSPTIHRDMPRNQIRRVFRVPIEEGPLHYATSSPVEENTTQTEVINKFAIRSNITFPGENGSRSNTFIS